MLPNLLLFYGFFLIGCGITAVVFIGSKAKTALISGGTSGTISLILSWLVYQRYPFANYGGMFIAFALFIVFSWRATKTLVKVFELIPQGHEDLKGKGIAFLIIGLMAVVSIVVFMLQVVLW